MSLASSAANQVLVAEINDVRPFARLLRGIGMKHNAVMTISEAGFEVTVEEIRTMCAIAWIPTNLFSTFTFNEPPTNLKPCFELSIDKLLQVLNIFGNATSGSSRPLMQSRRRWAGDGEDGAEPNVPLGKGSTAMRMTWDGHGYPLQVDLHESARGPTTTAKFNLMEPEELMNQEFNSDDCVLYLIMKTITDRQSNWFIDALADIPPSASRITISASPRHQPPPDDVPQATASSNARRSHQAHVGKFTMKATGDFGTAELDYPNDKEVMDKFDCEEEVSFSYHSSHVALLGRALQQSIKICLQIESTGFMCIQVMMPVPEGLTMGQHSGILEFKMHALEEDDV